jgi:DNA repair protein RecO (recombination protein O)
MPKQIITQGIVLSRTEYGEADRIINFLTPDYGKVAGIAKGVRKSKSKLAGGIELFSISQLSFIVGKSDIYTITSARLVKYFDNIVKNLERTNLGYELIKQLNRATEDNPEPEYFDLLQQAFEALDDHKVSLELISTWFSAQLLRLAGHTPNLYKDAAGQQLSSEQTYDFNFDDVAFMKSPKGHFNSQHIKTLRILFSANKLQAISQVQGISELIVYIKPVIQAMRENYIRQ